MNIRPLMRDDFPTWLAMRREFFDDCTEEQHLEEFTILIRTFQPKVGHAKGFIALDDDDKGLGFAEVMIRSHAEGCWDLTADGTLGVPHLEGLFILPQARRAGVASGLMTALKTFCKIHGFDVLASDTALTNTDGQQFHEALGFIETDRNVHYRMNLK